VNEVRIAPSTPKSLSRVIPLLVMVIVLREQLGDLFCLTLGTQDQMSAVITLSIVSLVISSAYPDGLVFLRVMAIVPVGCRSWRPAMKGGGWIPPLIGCSTPQVLPLPQPTASRMAST
jgi:hypothetical protein